MMHQFHTTTDWHDFSPFCHVCRRNINHIAIFIAVLYFKAVIRKYRTSLYKRSIWKRNSFSVMNQWTEDVENTLHTGTNHNIVRGTVDISALSDIISNYLAKICFSLRVSIREKAVTLTKCTFDITLPEIESKTFAVNTV